MPARRLGSVFRTQRGDGHRPSLSYSNIVATLALLIAVGGGTALAAGGLSPGAKQQFKHLDKLVKALGGDQSEGTQQILDKLGEVKAQNDAVIAREDTLDRKLNTVLDRQQTVLDNQQNTIIPRTLSLCRRGSNPGRDAARP